MKKSLLKVIGLGAAFVLSLSLTGCPNDKKQETKPQTESPKIEEISQQQEVQSVEKKEEPKVEEEKPKTEEVKKETWVNVSLSEINLQNRKLVPFEDFDKHDSSFDENQLGFIYSKPSLYPIGWSKDGKFAYRTDRYFEGAGESRSFYIIVDTVTDRVLYSEFDVSEKDVDAQLNKYKIYLQDGKYYAQGKGENPDGPKGVLTFRTSLIKTEADDVGTDYSDFNCWAQTHWYAKDLTTQTHVQTSSVFVCGSIKSPFEPRVAVILAFTRRGFEGFDLEYSIIGCHTEVGFSETEK